MDLNDLRDRAYKTACDHGFHDEELSNEHCLCLVISELKEAVEADRKGRLGKKCKSRFEMDYNRYPALVEEEKRFKCSFEKNVKDTLPDELADAVIRLLDLAGLRGIDLSDTNEIADEFVSLKSGFRFTEVCFGFTLLLTNDVEGLGKRICFALAGLIKYCQFSNIDLIWHINQKMRYNELRENKHGKKY